MHYDPVNDDFIVSERGSGAEYINSSGERKRLTISKNYDLSEMNGFVPYYIFSYKFGRKVAENILKKFLEFERVNSLRCSLHEYNQMCFANAEFSLSTHTNIWDHGAGQLMLSECGGVSGILGEGVSKFKPYGNSGFLLSANSQDVWYKINDIFLSAIKS